ncbi:MAG: MipA/OmpV family protein [Pseudomonadota bacterium]
MRPTPIVAALALLVVFCTGRAAGTETLVPHEDTLAAPAVTVAPQATGTRKRKLIFTALLAAEGRPAYFGADETIPFPRISPNVLSVSFGALQYGDEDASFDDDPNLRPMGLGFGPSLRYITSRRASDNAELTGLNDIQDAFEVGAQVFYVWPNVETFAALRYGLWGHESWVGELGGYYVLRPGNDFAFRFGPRLLYGTDRFADTYFGVTPAEALASSFSAYDPDGGLVSAGLEMIATYQLSRKWWLEGRVRWDRLQGDAAGSPIVAQGSEDMFTFSIGFRRAFELSF